MVTTGQYAGRSLSWGHIYESLRAVYPLLDTLRRWLLIKYTQLLGLLCLRQCLLLPSLWCQLKLRPKVTKWKSSYCCWFVRSLRACEVLMFSTVSPWLPSLDSQRICRLLSITLRWTPYSLIILTIIDIIIIIIIIIINIIKGYTDHCVSYWSSSPSSPLSLSLLLSLLLSLSTLSKDMQIIVHHIEVGAFVLDQHQCCHSYPTGIISSSSSSSWSKSSTS